MGEGEPSIPLEGFEMAKGGIGRFQFFIFYFSFLTERTSGGIHGL
jgi:hypothetical protein